MKEETKKGYLKLLKHTLGGASLVAGLWGSYYLIYDLNFSLYVIACLTCFAGYIAWFKKA